MKPNLRIAGDQRRPFRQGFLNPALAEIALPGGDQFLDLLGRPRLADGDQADVVRIALGDSSCARDLVQDSLTALGGNAHRVGYR